MKKEVKITTEFIKLDQFLKYVNIASSGAEAKLHILNGEVLVNGQIEKKRGKKLRNGDKVTYGRDLFIITGEHQFDS